MPVSRARKIFVLILSVSMLSALAVLGSSGSASAASTLVVGPGNYSTIAAALASASAGDTISVTAGTYTESLDVTTSVTLEGAGAATTTIIGKLTLDAPATVTGFTIEGQTATPTTSAPYAPTTLWIDPSGAGSDIHDDVLKNGYQDVYAQGVVGTASQPTIVANNLIQDFHADQGTGVWIAQSSYFTVTHNTITDGSPIDDNAVGVNLVCGSSHVTIDSNTINDVGNATVDIANGTCSASTDVAITNNAIGPTSGSALYFGANNLTGVTVSGNVIDSVGGSSGAVVLSGYSGWLASPGVNISGFVVESNTVSGAPNGLYIGDGVLLDTDSSVLSRDNTWCSSGDAIDNLSTGGFTVESLDDSDCGRAVSPGVVVNHTPPPPPSSTSPAKSTTVAAAAATPVATSTPTAGPLAITGNASGTSKQATVPHWSKDSIVPSSSSGSSFLWILLIIGALVVILVIVLIARRARRA